MPVDHENSGAKTERLGLRASAWQRSLLTAASRAEGTSVSEFVLKHATRAAEDVLADRRVFMLPSAQWDAFNEALDRPAKELPRLRKLLGSPTVLDM
jgi:uncharacterized protein (DUF1778 family)